MNKILSIILVMLVTSSAIGQVVGRVDKKTKEFSIAPDQKSNYTIVGYQYPNNTTKKMICFSSNVNTVQDNLSKCQLGSYFDTDKMKVGDKIIYVGVAGTFAKMNYVTGTGRKIMFYLPKSSFAIK